jgi:PAS domain S-box-containing protein
MNRFNSLKQIKYTIIVMAILWLIVVELAYVLFLERDARFVVIDLALGSIMIFVFAEIAFYYGGKLEKQLRHELQERMEVEAELRLRSTALETAANAIAITDSNGRFQWINPAFTALTGYTAEEVLGQTHALLRSGQHDSAFYAGLWQTISAGNVWQGEIVNKRKDGALYTEEQIITPVLDANNRPAFYIAIKHDITARKTAETTLRQYAERLRLIHNIDQAILSKQEPQEIAQVALSYARQIIPSDRASVIIFDIAREEGTILSMSQEGETAVSAGHTFPINQAQLNKFIAAEPNTPAAISEFNHPTSAIGQQLKAEGFQAQIKIPLVAQQQIIGFFNLGAKDKTRFTEDHIAIAQEIATSLAIGLQQARLYQSERRQRQQAETLRTTGEALNSTLDFDEVLHILLDQLTKVIPYDSANIILIQDDTASIRQTRGYERYGQDTLRKVSNLNFSISQTRNLQTIVRTQEPLIIPDVRQYEGWHKDKGISQTRSWVGVPILVNNVIVALFALSKQELNFYQESDVDILRAFASQAGLALENARLYEELREYAAKLETRVRARTKALAEANERLKELDRLKTKFISDVSHELRTPITNISMYLDLLIRGKAEKHEHYLSILQQETQRLSQLIEDIFDESPHTSHLQQADYDIVDMNEVIFRTLALYQNEADRKGLALSYNLLSNLPVIWGEHSQLNRVMSNLLKNSITYTQEGEVKVTTALKNNWISILVEDTGVGIAAADMPHVFDRFYRGQNASQLTIPGAGLGLSAVREIVGLHGGSVTAANNERGATFEILLPASPQRETTLADYADFNRSNSRFKSTI